MINQNNIDHLFRHQHGRMVAVLTRFFGLEHLETIEDAVQDTFVQAMLSWRTQMPKNPEGWLIQAAKNRTIDLFRKLNAEKKRLPKVDTGPAAIALYDMFLETEIADSQLRMIFTACHPKLNPKDQLSFALKTISGFSQKEIAAALLLKEDTVKKRLQRARQLVKTAAIAFEIPKGKTLTDRLSQVLEVLYLIFNEGFHSNSQKSLIRKELCGEAMRLCKMLLENKHTALPPVHALFALMCFQTARLESKTNNENQIIDLQHQDRSQWHWPLVILGNKAMNKAVENAAFTHFHFEAAIAAEHVKAKSFDETNWDAILSYYEKLALIQPSEMIKLNMAMVQIQRHKIDLAHDLLNDIKVSHLEQRSYLYYGAMAEYFIKKGEHKQALNYMNQAIDCVVNEVEKQYLLKKRNVISQAESLL